MLFMILTLFYKLNEVKNLVLENDSNRLSNKIAITALVVITATVGYGQKLFFYTGVMQSYVFAKDYFDRANKFKAYHDDKFAELVVTPSQHQFSNPSTIIMVIGESASRTYMSAYNNTKNYDTPWLRAARNMETFFGRMKNEMYYGYEKNYQSFEEFKNAVEEYIYYYNERIQKKNKMDATCKIQDGIHMPRIIKKCVQDSGYISYAWICDSLANTNEYKYDGDLLDYLRNVDPTKNSFVVLHFMGSHEDCINCYPHDFARFSEKCVYDMPLNYDDSLAYSDYLLQQIKEYSEKNLNLQVMLYFSDHGGDPYRKRHPDQSGFKFLRIPMFIYVSDECQKLYSEAVKEFKSSKDEYYTNDLNYELVCELLQIKSNHYNEENSILNKKYKFTRDPLTTNLGRTKLSEDEE